MEPRNFKGKRVGGTPIMLRLMRIIQECDREGESYCATA